VSNSFKTQATKITKNIQPMSKAEAKAKRKAHEKKKKAVAAKEGKKFMYIVIGIAAVMLVILYFVFQAGMG